MACRHSGPQGKVKPFTIIDDPADWKRSDWVGREAEYTYNLTPEDVAELSAAVDALQARGVASEDDIIAVRPLVSSPPPVSMFPGLRQLYIYPFAQCSPA